MSVNMGSPGTLGAWKGRWVSAPRPPGFQGRGGLGPREDTTGMCTPMSMPGFSAAMQLLWLFEGCGHVKRSLQGWEDRTDMGVMGEAETPGKSLHVLDAVKVKDYTPVSECQLARKSRTQDGCLQGFCTVLRAISPHK